MAYPPLTGLFAERYEIERELGHGATAVVYLAHDNKHDRQIALKVLSKDLAHALGPQRFLREIHLTARLHHPHILPIFDSGEWNGLLYYVLPFVRGESLRDKIDREKQLTMEDCVRITCEVAGALSHAHAQGVVHRDVKPENIMLSDDHALLADFGIARTLDVHTGERLTSSGLIVGTSAYMSPEQAAGEETIDARSDIYSLACVLYEMIAGVQAFTGPTTQSIIAQRFKHTPRPVSNYRPAVPEHVERALEKALAIAPADRYSNIKHFAEDLSDAPLEIRDRRRSPVRRAIHGKQKAFGFAAIAVLVLTAAFVIANPPGNWKSPFAKGPAVDPLKYMIAPAPIAGSAVTAADLASADSLAQAFARFTDLRVVAPEVIQDIFANQSTIKSKDLFALARENHAGRVIRISSTGEARLYDAVSEQQLNSVTGARGSGADRYTSSAIRLLSGRDWPAAVSGAEGYTNLAVAWNAYGEGHTMLARGDFAGAKKEFAAALAADPNFAPAQLWVAQVNVWGHPDSAADWKELATKAAHHSPTLTGRDSALASALSAMASGEYPTACHAYSGLLKRDQLDFAAWFGVGECNELDSMAVQDSRSPSGFSYRSGSETAAQGFMKAARLIPAAHDVIGFERMEKLLPIGSNKVRGGYADSHSGTFVLAYPSLSADTLAFFPFPISRFASLPAASTSTRAAAINRNRQLLLTFAAEWAQRFPKNPDALEAVARMLETKGDIADLGNGSPSAMSAIGKARETAGSSEQSLRLAATEVRLRLKLSDFVGAEHLADSLLRHAPAKSDAMIMTRLAALTGRAGEMAHWAALAHIPSGAGSRLTIPPQLVEPGALFFARSALGICGAKTNAIETQLEQLLQSYTRTEDRAPVRSVIEGRSLGFQAPCTNGESALRTGESFDRLHRLQQYFAKHDYHAVKALLDTVRLVRKDMLPGEVSLDYTYQEAWLRAAMGDVNGAASALDLSLNALPSLSIPALDEAAATAALGRGFALRVELAVKMRDQETARRWAGALTALWSHADPELQTEVRRVGKLAGAK
jgi:tRNA A-37 threonylcarbamoyl transferase component Bud32/tetratricopeptide (TPR) repeat protein